MYNVLRPLGYISNIRAQFGLLLLSSHNPTYHHNFLCWTYVVEIYANWIHSKSHSLREIGEHYFANANWSYVYMCIMINYSLSINLCYTVCVALSLARTDITQARSINTFLQIYYVISILIIKFLKSP